MLNKIKQNSKAFELRTIPGTKICGSVYYFILFYFEQGHQSLRGALQAPGACYKNKLKQNKIK
jgi:hypothetical protein